MKDGTRTGSGTVADGKTGQGSRRRVVAEGAASDCDNDFGQFDSSAKSMRILEGKGTNQAYGGWCGGYDC